MQGWLGADPLRSLRRKWWCRRWPPAPPPFAYRHIAAQESDVEHHDRTPARAFGVRGGRCRGLFLEQDRKIWLAVGWFETSQQRPPPPPPPPPSKEKMNETNVYMMQRMVPRQLDVTENAKQNWTNVIKYITYYRKQQILPFALFPSLHSSFC